jgi:hypothetical protein
MSLARNGRSLVRPVRLAAMDCQPLEGRALLSALTSDFQALVQELTTLHQSSNVTAAEVKAVASDFATIAKVATRPSSSSVSALEAEIATVVKSGTITPAEIVVLQKDWTAVLESANISTTLAKQTASDLDAVLISSGLTKTDVKTVMGDLEAIASDLAALKR